MAVPTFVNVSTTTGSTTSVVTARPTGLADGDLLVAFFASSSIDATITTPPTGWVRLHYPWRYSLYDFMEVWGKIASGEPATWTWTTSTGGQTGIIIQAWRPSTGAWTDALDAIVATDYGLQLSGNVTPAYPPLGTMSPSAIDHALLTACVTRRGDGTITQPTSHTKAGQIIGGGFDNGALIKFSTSYRTSTAAAPPAGNWGLSSSRTTTVWSIQVRDPSVARPRAVARFIGDRSDTTYATWIGTAGPISLPRCVGAAIGDTEVLIVGYRAAVYVNTPSGYTLRVQQTNAVAVNDRVSIFERVLDGTEGTSVSLSWSATCTDGAFQAYSVNGPSPTFAGSAVVDSTLNATMDLPSLTVAATASPGAVYIAGVVLDRNDGSSVTTAPASMQLMGRSRAFTAGTQSCRLASAVKLSTAANDGPATFPLASNYIGLGFDISYAAAPPATPRARGLFVG